MLGREKHLTSERIIQLDGHPIRLSSPYAEGRLLTISPTGEVTSEPPGSGFDQYWRIIQTDDGFLLLSSKNLDMICHHMADGGCIVSKSLSSESISDCVWNLGKRGEIYQPNPDGGERYLWLANDKLYATLDGFLAENWVPLPDIKHPSISPTYNSQNEEYSFDLSPFIIIAVVIAIIFVIWLYLRKKPAV